MALVVEDGSLVSGANSYVSFADATQYLTDRGITVEVTEGHLLRAADYINSFAERYKGYQKTGANRTTLSTMQWPRQYVSYAGIGDCYGYIPDDKIPDLIIHAQIESALEIASNRDPLSTVSARQIKKQKVDVIEVEYDTSMGSSGQDIFDHRRVMALLSPFLKGGDYFVERG